VTTLIDAWQAALAAEQQASFGYDLLGAHLHGTPQLPLAVACSNAHDQLATATAQQLADAAQPPVAPAADYPALYPVGDARTARLLAVRLEDQCAAAWRYLYAVAADSAEARAPALRARAQGALTMSAVRATRWRRAARLPRSTVAFPGL
jgi:hypothetical protein